MIKFTEVEFVQVNILRVNGRLTLGEGCQDFRDKISDLVKKQEKKFLLIDLSGVSYIDASGIGELVSAFTTVTNSGGLLKLLSPTNRIVDTLQITKLYCVFEVYQDEKTAIESFRHNEEKVLLDRLRMTEDDARKKQIDGNWVHLRDYLITECLRYDRKILDELEKRINIKYKSFKNMTDSWEFLKNLEESIKKLEQ